MSSFTKVVSWAVFAALLFVTAIVLLQTYLSTVPSTSPAKGLAPYQRHTQIFRTILDLEDMSPNGDRAWDTKTSTLDGGFLWIQHNETYKTGWGVSMFHALHCLQMIRAVLKENPAFAEGSTHLHGLDKHHANNRSEGNHNHVGMLDYDHVNHCLSYVAQSLLCAADGTVEQPRYVKDDNGNILKTEIDGENVEHVCHDQSVLWRGVNRSEQKALVLRDWEVGDTVETILAKVDKP